VNSVRSAGLLRRRCLNVDTAFNLRRPIGLTADRLHRVAMKYTARSQDEDPLVERPIVEWELLAGIQTSRVVQLASGASLSTCFPGQRELRRLLKRRAAFRLLTSQRSATRDSRPPP